MTESVDLFTGQGAAPAQPQSDQANDSVDLFTGEAVPAASVTAAGFGNTGSQPPRQRPSELVQLGRYAGATAKGVTDALTGAVGGIPDLVASGLRTAGLPAPRPGFYTDNLRKGLSTIGEVSAEVLTGQEDVPPFRSVTPGERIFEGVGQGIGSAATVMVPAAAVANTARTGTVTQGVAQTLASNPVVQSISAGVGGGVAEATDNPYLGMLAGMGTGMAAGGGTSVVAKALETARQTARLRADPRLAAQTQVLKSLGRDNVTPNQVEARLRTLGPQATIADAGGENLKATARLAAGQPGQSRGVATRVLQNRMRGEGARLTDSLQKNLEPRDYWASEDQFLGALKANAQRTYGEAYRAGPLLQSKRLDELLSRPGARSGLEKAREIAANEGYEINLPPRGISTQSLDQVKKGIDALISGPNAINQKTKGPNDVGKSLIILKNEILREADRLNPAYAKARKVYGGDLENLQALRDGAGYNRMRPEEIRRAMAGMSQSEQEAFRSGAAREIMKTIDKTRDTASISNRLFGNAETRNKLRALFPSDQSFRDFKRELLREAEFADTRNSVLVGSRTAPMQMDAADQAGGLAGDVATDVVTGTPGSNAIVRRLLEMARRPNPNTADELAPMLFSQDPAINQATMAGLRDLPPLPPSLRNQLQRRVMELLRASDVGATAGALGPEGLNVTIRPTAQSYMGLRGN